jgi:acetylornithine/succinyldiaminopimelate/putrescine aminotransferase
MPKKTAVAKKTPAPKSKVAKPAVARKTVKKAAQPKKVEKKQAKQNVVRDSFTMPEDEYRVLSEIKKKCLAGGIDVKKSELLRAGLQSLAGMTQAALKKQLSKLAEIKTGRPAKSSKGK